MLSSVMYRLRRHAVGGNDGSARTLCHSYLCAHLEFQ